MKITIHQALSGATEKLSKTSQSPLFDAEILLAHTLKKSREFVLAHPEKTLNKNQKAVFKKMIARRSKNEPVAYILGHKEFYGLDFKVNRHTLIPRPETELLVEKSLFLLRSMLRNNWHNKIAIIDIGTGSGNIVISFAKNLKNKNNYFGIDISAQALQVARHNASKNKVESPPAGGIKFIQGNLLEPILNTKYQILNTNLIILANLPYLSSKIYSVTPPNVKNFEPKSALLANQNGLYYYEKLFQQINILKKDYSPSYISCFLEISPEQKSKMQKLIKKYFPASKPVFHKDLAGKFRLAEFSIS